VEFLRVIYRSTVDALRQSCDVFFYQMGPATGLDNLNKYAEMYGLADYTQIDLPNEKKGLLVNEESYNKRFKKKIEKDPKWAWSKGIELMLSIGQGQLATPLQLANFAAGLGNMEKIYKPRLIRYEFTVNNQKKYHSSKVLRYITLKNSTKEILKEAFYAVVNKPGGTGQRARIRGVNVGGKTGSAENPHGDKTHALFICMAPLENPEIAISVVIENIGGGGANAAPIAKAILEAYFNKSKI